MYTPHKNLVGLQPYDYHQFTELVKEALVPLCLPPPVIARNKVPSQSGLNSTEITTSPLAPRNDVECTIFLSTVPDLYLALKENPQYSLKHAIDPNYPINEENYKKVLDQTDIIIYTWLPHEFLANYVTINAQSVIPVEQPGGYGAFIVKLKPKDQRR